MATTEKGNERLTQFLDHVNGDPGGGIASLQGTGTFWSTPHRHSWDRHPDIADCGQIRRRMIALRTSDRPNGPPGVSCKTRRQRGPHGAWTCTAGHSPWRQSLLIESESGTAAFAKDRDDAFRTIGPGSPSSTKRLSHLTGSSPDYGMFGHPHPSPTATRGPSFSMGLQLIPFFKYNVSSLPQRTPPNCSFGANTRWTLCILCHTSPGFKAIYSVTCYPQG